LKLGSLLRECKDENLNLEGFLFTFCEECGIKPQKEVSPHSVNYHCLNLLLSSAFADARDTGTQGKSHAYPTFVVEHKLYWAAFSDPNEDHYVVAVLNSATANQAIKPFQSTGLMGERDIEKKLLELPIPVFNPEDTAHRKLSELGAAAMTCAQEAFKSSGFPANGLLARQRAFVRTHLEAEMQEIDDLVAKLLSK
jgi:hypothetical protein